MFDRKLILGSNEHGSDDCELVNPLKLVSFGI